jgi:chemotaxis protein methyltransferase CheR
MTNKINITQKEFLQLKEIIYKHSGLDITQDDIIHLQNKLYDRLEKYNLKKFRDYYEYLLDNYDEIQSMINAITTNETYFFREQKHFDFLKTYILPKVKYDKFRCWSAAGSYGAEAYSIAMDIDTTLSAYQNWEIVASDINDDVIKFAQQARYPMKYAKKIPLKYLKNYCLKGQNEDKGFFRIKEKLKQTVNFKHINLMNIKQNDLGLFDVIFLRNMIIYFNDQDKKTIVQNVLKYLKDGGYLFMGHSESLFRITNKVKQIHPSIYQKI